jgi:hypothetical protein
VTVAPHQLLDSISIAGAFFLIVVTLLVVFELGFRIGRWHQIRTPEVTEGPHDLLVGSLLALLAFLLAFTVGMADDRFDARRADVVAEANAIYTAYLRAGYLPVAESEATRALLREYTPLRIDVDDLVQLEADSKRSEEIHTALWAIAERIAREQPSDVIAAYIESLNDMINVQTERATSLIYGRVPETIILLLIGGSALSLGMVGYSAGLSGRRSPLTAIVLVITLSAVITLVLDLDRPRNGFVEVSQQPLVELAAKIGAK